MCGIIGCIAPNARTSIINGLNKMQYRGYDSAGLAYVCEDNILCDKTLGKPTELIGKEFGIGIGHTRWATHGKVSLENAHPHFSYDKKLAIVHNGIIENHRELKKIYLDDINLISETDTEVLVNLIAKFYQEFSLIESIKIVQKLLKGSYAFIILTQQNTIYYAVNKMPLIIGVGDGLYIASDVLAFPKTVNKVCYLKDKKIGKLTKKHQFMNIKLDDYDIFLSKNNMLNEIEQIPSVLNKIKNIYKADNSSIKPILELINKNNRCIFIASGSSYNAAKIGAYFFNKYLNKEVKVFFASEFSYYPVNEKNTLYFFISQSGETADVLKSYNSFKSNKKIVLTNVLSSTLAHKTKYVLSLNAYPEIGVAATKTFIATMAIFYLLSSPGNSFNTIIKSVKKVLAEKEMIYDLALKNKEQKYFIFIGKGIDYLVNLENVLKLKEVTYSYVDNYYSGELKHGPLALCDQDTMVFIINSSSKTNSILRSNVSEIKARGSKCFLLSSKKNAVANDYSFLCNEELTIFECAVFFELFAFFLATIRKYNPDQPRNLAKSVTVE